ncbi:MAG: hypothetical protein WBA20_18095 [Ketobacter sp.]
MIIEKLESKIKFELVVLLEEDHGYRWWFWFPSINISELERRWSLLTCDEYDQWWERISVTKTHEPLPGYIECANTNEERELWIALSATRKYYRVEEQQGTLIRPDGTEIELKDLYE